MEIEDENQSSSEEHNFSNEEDEEGDKQIDEGDRTNIRSELKGMSFSELIKLKDELGSKVYNEAMFGENSTVKRKKPKAEFKRENKNRPREATTKKQVPLLGVRKSKKQELNGPRDPRFDSRCGEFDRDKFKEDYEFVNEIKESEAVQLKEQLRNSTDETEKEKIKILIQRMKNQNREAKKLKEKRDAKKEQTGKISSAVKDDKKPFFVTKREAKAQELVKQYLELKSSGKLNKHIERRRKKNTTRDRKKYKFN